MAGAGWADVWHLALGIVARQPPFAQIMFATGAVFVVVMALEGVRTSLLAIARAHRIAPPLAAPAEHPIALALPAPLLRSNGFFAKRGTSAATRAPRKRKPLTVGARQFAAPRPTIRRHTVLVDAHPADLPLSLAHTPALRPEGV